jgi:tetratricopeptide (TPR) repeat protein
MHRWIDSEPRRSERIKGSMFQRRAARIFALMAFGLWTVASFTCCAAQCKPPAKLDPGSEKSPSASAYLNLGTWFAEHRQFDCASKAFRSALELDPSSAKINYFLGLSLYSSHQVEASLGPLQKSVALDAAAMQPRLLLAEVLKQLGRSSEAEDQWRAVLKLDPASTAALDGLCNSLIDKSDPTPAIDMLLAAKQKRGLTTDLTLDLARAYGVAQMLDDAGATLKEALAKSPNGPSSLRLTHALATVYVRQERFQDAETLMKAYLDRHPAELDAQVFYLRILVLNEDHAKAIPLGRKLLALAPHNFDALYLNGILDRETGAYEAARDHLREAVALQPDDYSARYNYGTALLQLHDAAGAKEQLQKAVALDESQADAHFQLALALRALGEKQEAQEQMKTYQQLSSSDAARAQAATEAELAAQKLAAGDAQQAVNLYRRAVSETPQDPMLNYRLSTALRQAGDADGERAALEQTVKIDPTFALAQNQLGYLDFHSGAYPSAEGHFRQAVESAPAFTGAWMSLAATLASEGRLPEAREAVASALRLDPKNAQALQLAQDLHAADDSAEHSSKPQHQ